MGYQTDFVGYLQVEPPLNDTEIRLINGISGSADVVGAARNGLHPVTADEALLAVARAGAPPGWSNWSACGRGCCLSYDGGDKANHMAPWLKFLMTALLLPGSQGQSMVGREGAVEGHVLNGMVVGARRDTRELYAICLQDNDLSVELLWPGNKDWSTYPPLAYQVAIDRFREWPAPLGRP
jgi:hypothetical protein